MKKLITLAKNLDFQSETDYFDYCIASWANGNFSQCKELFFAMKKEDRKRLLAYIHGCFDHRHDVEKFYMNLL